MNCRKVSKLGERKRVVESERVEVEFRGELLRSLKEILSSGLYENEEEFLRDCVRRLKEGTSVYGGKKANQKIRDK